MLFQFFTAHSFLRRLTTLSILSAILLIVCFLIWQLERSSKGGHHCDAGLSSVRLEGPHESRDGDAMNDGVDQAAYRELEMKHDQTEIQVILRGNKVERRPRCEDKVYKIDSDKHGLAPVRASTRYMTYLPHSGFHNQRIALINALHLASLLNRTLLVPPVVLGEPIHWREADELEAWHRRLSKACMTRCVRSAQARHRMSLGCKKSAKYTSLRWDRLFDLRALKSRIAIHYRDDYDPGYLAEHFGIVEEDIFRIKDSVLYDYRISDVPRQGALGKYRRELLLEDLRRRPEKLIQFGSLFGTGRIALASARSTTSDSDGAEFRNFIETQFVLSRKGDVLDGLFDLAEAIVDRLGGSGRFLSVHARVGDSIFERFSEKVMSKLWRDLQAYVPKQHQHVMSAQVCLDAIQANTLGNNTQVLFMATDAFVPRASPLLKPLFEAFPCVITLEDVFDYANSALATLVNPEDGVVYGRFLVPFLDSLVASRSRAFTGSMWSTFSGYIRFLHSTYMRNNTMYNT